MDKMADKLLVTDLKNKNVLVGSSDPFISERLGNWNIKRESRFKYEAIRTGICKGTHHQVITSMQ